MKGGDNMPRVTKADLVAINESYLKEIHRLDAEVDSLTNIIRILETYPRGITTMTAALERVTDAVAHVLTDLKKKG